ncbi:BACON domain-containing protein [Pontibacter mucosus]|uniref:BACON domain-containing protein n=1 Tax=Pontibacter mucosus TaxID=1649266 RepID=UPI000D3542B6|nr:BACON domain-containing protein [Pontibacter mucosus]
MKRAKINYISLIPLLLLLFVAASCAKEDMPAKPQPSAFTVELQNKLTAYPASGATIELVINAGSNGWWMVVPEESKAWCKPAKFYGSGNQTVLVTLAPNTTGASRKAEITINPTFNLEPVRLTIEQLPN